MNTTLKVIYILIFACIGNTHAEVSLDFSDHLDGEARWQLRKDSVLSLKMDGDSTVFMLGEKKEVFRLKSREYVRKVVVSEDGKVVVFAIMKKSGRGGSNYSTLVIVSSVGSGVKVKRALISTGRGVPVPKALPPKGKDKKPLGPEKKFFGGRRWWVSELGAISNDGTRILAEFGVMSPPKNNSSKVVYSWYILEVATGRILGVGLTIENGKTPARQ